MPLPAPMRLITLRLSWLAAFVAGLWALQLLNWISGYGLNAAFGLIPRHLSGLDGILGAPLLHGSFAHLSANTPPLLVMGTLLATTATRALIPANAIIVGLGGLLVWLFGSAGIHIGASGLVFGWLGFLLLRGAIDRSPVTLASSVLVAVLYGAALWGVLPGQPGVSWEGHLFGFLAGALAAVVVRAPVHDPRLRDVGRP